MLQHKCASWLIIKTHNSELRRQEAGLRDERVSYLHEALL